MRFSTSLLLIVTSLSISAEAEPWRAGTAIAVITPDHPMMLAGFGSRKRPAEGTFTELHAKALAFEDEAGTRLVIITCDLIGIPRPLRERVEKHVGEKFRLPPESLLLNASHTHCGPELQMTPTALEELSDERKKLTIKYCQRLEDTLVELIGQALDDLAPVKLRYSHSRCGFAMNRRLKNPDPSGEPYLNHPNPDGPVDHDVPVLQVVDTEGQLRAVLFGYACHNTTMWENQYAGDYAGYAQRFLEQDHPGAIAMFMTGCAGDQCGYPRGTMIHARRHGRTLATAVDAALGNKQRTINGDLQLQFSRVEIDYAPPPTRGQLESVVAGRSDATFKDYELTPTHAKRLLRQLDREGSLRLSYDYPVQTTRFGNDLVLVALAGEVVVDYSLRLKREFAGSAAIWVAGYSNDVFAYIPSRRLLQEGGYEPRRSMNWMTTIVQPGPFALSTEERIVEKVHELLHSSERTTQQ